MKTVLGIDASMNGCGAAALSARGRAFRSVAMSGGQAEHLMPMIGEVLEDAGLVYKDLEVLITTLGPGAFTGLRIGLSTAKALAMSLDIPLFGITTFQALALAYAKTQEGSNVAVIIETKRTDFYVQRFNGQGKALSEPAALDAEEVFTLIQSDDVLIGDGVDRYREVCMAAGQGFDGTCVRMGYDLPDMALVLESFQDHASAFTDQIEPLYLRGADVSEAKTKPRILASQ